MFKILRLFLFFIIFTTYECSGLSTLYEILMLACTEVLEHRSNKMKTLSISPNLFYLFYFY